MPETMTIQEPSLVEQLQQAHESIRILTSEIRNLKAKTRFKVYEENLQLALKVDRYEKALNAILDTYNEDSEVQEDVELEDACDFMYVLAKQALEGTEANPK